MARRDDGDGYLREVLKSGKNGRGEPSFSVSVIQSRTDTEGRRRVLEGASAETVLGDAGSTRSWRPRCRLSAGLGWI